MHPAELLAAAVWFTLITWLMFKTKNIWDGGPRLMPSPTGSWALRPGHGQWQFM